MIKKRIKTMIPIEAPNLDTLFDDKRSADRARIILQYLFHIRIRINNYYTVDERTEGWCSVSAENLRYIVYNYEKIIAVLIENDIVEYRENAIGGKSYHQHKNPMQYRVCFHNIKHSDEQRYRVEYVQDSMVIRGLSKYYNRQYKNTKTATILDFPWLKESTKFLESLYLEIDEGESTQIENLEHQSLINYFNNGLGRYFKRDEFAGRIHTHLVNLPKAYRWHLKSKINREPLCEIDIKSAQPFLLSAIFYRNSLLELMPEFEPIRSVIKKYANEPSTRLFYEDCSKGQMYNRIMEITGLDKSEVKKRVFHHILYCSPSNHIQDDKIWIEREQFQKLFRTIYPAPFKTLIALKRTKRSTLPFVYEKTGKNGRGRMYVTPNLLAATLEVKMLIDGITKKCCKEHIPVTTIHDAWIIPQSYTGRFNQIFNDYFSGLGVNSPSKTLKILNKN